MINTVNMVGRVGREPEERVNPSSGKTTLVFVLAVNNKYREKRTGNVVEQIFWIPCEAYGNLVGICSKLLYKGAKASVQGTLNQASWKDKNGVPKSRVWVVVRDIEVLVAKRDKPTPQTPIDNDIKDDDVGF